MVFPMHTSSTDRTYYCFYELLDFEIYVLCNILFSIIKTKMHSKLIDNEELK